MTRKINIVSKAIVAALLATAACGRADKGNNQSAQSVTSSISSSPQVTLTANQSKMLKVLIASMHQFHPGMEAIGTVSLADDPSVLQAEATLLTAAATDRQMAKELDRALQLRLTNGVSERELEQAKSDAATARSNYLTARNAALALGKTAVELDRLIKSGKIIGSSPRSVKWISLSVTELDSNHFQPGMKLSVATPDIPNQVFLGTLVNVYAVVDPNSHRVTMRAHVTDEKDQLKPGMLVTGTVETQAPFDALAVPESAIVREGDGTLTAWVTKDGRTFSQRTLQTGIEEGRQVQIISGLHASERVVTDGGIYLDNMLQAPSGD